MHFFNRWRRFALAFAVLPLALAFALRQARAADEQLVLRSGDRVVLIGSTLVERDHNYGYLETVLTERFKDQNITFRNLGWSGDTVWGEARAVFGTQVDGFRQLKEHVAALQPTVLLVGYGTNESFAGREGLPHFLDGLKVLLDTVAQTKARVVLLSPLREEDLGRPLPDPTEQNKRLELYTAALKQVAAERKYEFIDLFSTLVPAAKPAAEQALTDDEQHLTAVGYFHLAEAVDTICHGPAAKWRLTLHVPDGHVSVVGAGTNVTDVNREGSTVRWTITDDSLPLPIPATPANASYRFLSDRTIRVLGLPTGRYQLKIDGQKVLMATATELAGGVPIRRGPSFDRAEELRRAINLKNELYFNRWRPQNVTYLFLFRAGEQGRNAVEIPKFDPLIADAEKLIAELRVPQPNAYELSRVEEAKK